MPAVSGPKSSRGDLALVLFALGAAVLVPAACAQSPEIDDSLLRPGSGGAGTGGAAGGTAGGDTGGAAGGGGTDASAGASGSSGAASGGTAGAIGGGTAGATSGGTAGTTSGGTAGTTTGGTAGTGGAGGCNAGEKVCNQACVTPSPAVGCSTIGCTPCGAPPANSDSACAGGLCDFTCHGGFVRSGSTCVATGGGGTSSGGTSSGGTSGGGTSGGGSGGTGGAVTLCCPSTNCPGGLFTQCIAGRCQSISFNLYCDNAECDAYCKCPDNLPEGGGVYTGGSCVWFVQWTCDCHQ